jgi:hypothetical protein
MLYMVEMDLPDASQLAEWHAWYDAHLRKLLSVPGFLSAQRFQSLHPADAPYIAIYGIAGPHVISSPEYRARAGPESTGRWRSMMTNWKRNLLAGLDHAPQVPLEGWLAVIDRRADDAPPLPAGVPSLRPVGLDCSMVERGLRIGTRGDPPQARAERAWQVRVCRPLTPFMKTP